MMIGVYNHLRKARYLGEPLPFSEGEPGSLGISKHIGKNRDVFFVVGHPIVSLTVLNGRAWQFFFVFNGWPPQGTPLGDGQHTPHLGAQKKLESHPEF